MPEREAPAIVTREPRPIGVRRAIASSAGSLPSSSAWVGKAAGRSVKGVTSATSSADAPLMVSTRTSDG